MADRRSIGNYVLCGELAKGGMATIWIGHAVGSTRPLALKMLSAHGSTPELMTMFLDELAVATRVRHLNVVESIEVVSSEDNDDLCLVMEYIEGETLSRLVRACREQGLGMPIPIAARIVCGALQGLHAVHEATDERGTPLAIVHRDVSPQNIVVGVDGIPRLLDFGVAKAAVRLQETRTGQLKGKVAYMAPEQLERNDVSRLTDLYAMGIVLWEALVGRRLFEADTEGQLVHRVLQGTTETPSSQRKLGGGVPKELDAVVMRALSPAPEARYPTARHFAGAIELATPLATSAEVAEWMQNVARKTLEVRARRVAKMLGTAAADSASGPAVGPSSTPSLPTTTSSRPLITTTSVDPPGGGVASSRATGGLRAPLRTSGSGLRSRNDDAAPVSSGLRAPGKHVLVIDDSPVILERARAVLEADGYRVTTTTQTVGAARYLVDCDLALIDFHMPGLSGTDVIQSLRAAANASGRTCLFYLYTSDVAIAQDWSARGFDGVLAGKGDDAALLRGVRAAFRVLQLRALRSR